MPAGGPKVVTLLACEAHHQVVNEDVIFFQEGPYFAGLCLIDLTVEGGGEWGCDPGGAEPYV